MLTERLPQKPLPAPKTPYTPCPPTACRDEWRAIPGAARWTALAKTVRPTPPPLPLRLWTDLTRTGCRARFERVYFARRRALVRLVMAECVQGEGRFLPAVADYVWAICEESAWQLPAHNTYVRDTPQLPLPDVTRPVVDLYAAETGALLSMTHWLLGGALQKGWPGLAARIRREVETRVLRPWRTEHFWWMGDGAEPMCNWTPWCTQNCLLATALLYPKNARCIDAAVRQGAYSLDCFLKDYGPDGCCSEGAQYYRHAALTLYNALELLCALAPGVFDDVWGEEKIKNMAEYIANMHVDGPYYLNFSDCSPLAGRRGAREYRFARRVGSAPLAALAAADLAADPDPDCQHKQDDSEGVNLLYAVQTAFTEQELLAAPREFPVQPDSWYGSVGVRVCRRGAYTVGIKAGGNGDSHNHNDTGSVTLYKDGRPLLIDVGVESYTKKTFSPRRYEIWTMQSGWHNLPEFDPDGKKYRQQPGAAFAAREVTPLADGLCMDIAPAYGPVPGLGFYRRRAELGEQGLALLDETDYPGPVALTLMSEQPPKAEDGYIRFGTLAAARVSGGVQRITTETVAVKDARLRTAWPDTLYRTRIYFTGTLRLQVT